MDCLYTNSTYDSDISHFVNKLNYLAHLIKNLKPSQAQEITSSESFRALYGTCIQTSSEQVHLAIGKCIFYLDLKTEQTVFSTDYD